MSDQVKIVYVDDDQDDQEFFSIALKKIKNSNAELIPFESGGELLDFLISDGTNRNREEQPDVIILDINMPVLSGTTVLKTLKVISETKDIPVFILSTSDSPDIKKQCRELGCRGYYVKPVKIGQLKTVIEKILRKTENRS